MARKSRRKYLVFGFVMIAVLVGLRVMGAPLQETLLSRSTSRPIPTNHAFFGWLSNETLISFGTDDRDRTDAEAVSVNTIAVTPVLSLMPLMAVNLRHQFISPI